MLSRRFLARSRSFAPLGALVVVLASAACNGDGEGVGFEAPPPAAIVLDGSNATPDPPATSPIVGDAVDSGGTGGGAVPEEESDARPAIPDEPYKVLLLGDSLAATGFGVILQKQLDAHPHVRCYRKAKSATGLARPDFFDWMAEGKRQVDLRDPDLVVVVLGGNDGQDLTNKRGTGKRVRWDTDDWGGAYKGRVSAFLEELTDDGQRRVLWLGLPTMGQRGLEKKLQLIRGLQEQAIADLGDQGDYLETSQFLTDDEGELLRDVKIGKRTRRLREDDGVHFTMPGSQYFADQVYPEILNELGLEPVDQ